MLRALIPFVLSFLISSCVVSATGRISSPVASAIPVGLGSLTSGEVAPSAFNHTELVRQGVVLSAGGLTAFDQNPPIHPTVLLDAGIYRMWYFAGAGSSFSIGYATSPDGRSWTKQGVVLSPSLPAEGTDVAYPDVIKVGSLFWMYYNGFNGSAYNVLVATSPDGLKWTKDGVVLSVGPSGSQDSYAVGYPNVLHLSASFVMFYSAINGPFGPANSVIARATSPDGLNWTKQGTVLSGGPPGSLDAFTLLASAVDLVGSTYQMIYYGNSDSTTTRQLYAASADGITWQKLGIALAPLSPNETLIAFNSFLVNATGGWWVWYSASGATSPSQVFLAISDSTPPVTTAGVVGTAGLNSWFVSSATVYLNATDDLSGVAAIRYSLDVGPWTNYSGPLILGDGNHTLGYQAEDNSGNWEGIKTLTVQVDTIAPVVTITSPEGAGTRSNLIISWTGSDSISGIGHYEVSIDEGPFLPVGTSTSISLALADGVHDVRVKAVDAAGNVALAQTRFSIDTNIFSPSGPYAGIPTYLILVGAVVAILLFLLWQRKKARPATAPPTAP